MLSLESKLDYLATRECLGCGCEPEVEAWLHSNGIIRGYYCSCGAVVQDDIYIGNSPTNN